VPERQSYILRVRELAKACCGAWLKTEWLSEPAMSTVVIVKIYADLDPIERYERFHNPLDADLATAGLGVVTGGGTLEDIETGRVVYSDLHVRIDSNLDAGLAIIRRTLSRCGVPPAELCIEGEATAIGLTSQRRWRRVPHEQKLAQR
jgi:hypothetical protein